jgi:Ca2+-transporting ATPase
MEDGLPDVALAFEPKEKDLMRQKPRNHNNPLLNKEMKIIIFIIGLITDLILLGVFMWLLKQDYNIEYIRTIIFACLAMDSISYIFSCKSLRKNIWHTDIFNNKLLIISWFLGLIGLFSALYVPFLNHLLGTIPLPFSSWPLIIGLAIINTVLIELVKYYFIKKDKLKNDY